MLSNSLEGLVILKTPAQSWSLPLPEARQPPLPPRQPGPANLRTPAYGNRSSGADLLSKAPRTQQEVTLRRQADVEQLQANSKSLVFNHQELRLRVFCVNQVTQNTICTLALLPGCSMCRSRAVFAGFQRSCLSAGSYKYKGLTLWARIFCRSVTCQPGDGDSRVRRVATLRHPAED